MKFNWINDTAHIESVCSSFEASRWAAQFLVMIWVTYELGQMNSQMRASAIVLKSSIKYCDITIV